MSDNDDDDEQFLSLSTPIQDLDLEAAKRELREARVTMPSLDELDSKKARIKALRYQTKQQQAGIVHIGRIPPNCGPTFVKDMLQPFGRIGRIYLKPYSDANGDKKKSGRFERGWVEFADKRHAKKCAIVLHGKSMGATSRARHTREELWLIEYLSKVKWDDLRLQHQHQAELHTLRTTKALDEGRQETADFLRDYQKTKEIQQSQANKEKRLQTKKQNDDDKDISPSGSTKRKANRDFSYHDEKDIARPQSKPKLIPTSDFKPKKDSTTFRKLM